MLQSDGQLVEAAMAGDRSAYGDLVDRYERAVRVISLRTLRDHHAAQDAAQETFVAAFQKLPKLRNKNAFGAWLLKIARTVAVRLDKQRRLHHPFPPEAAPVAHENNGRVDEATVALLDALERLPKHERAIVLLRHFQGHGVRQIAEMTGRPLGTVTKQLSRAHERLHVWLQKELER